MPLLSFLDENRGNIIGTKLEVTEERTYKLLSRLNPAKATGPDDLPNWLLREFASLVAFPVKPS